MLIGEKTVFEQIENLNTFQISSFNRTFKILMPMVDKNVIVKSKYL